MNELLSLAMTSAAGVLLGAMFFGGLWWTVRKGVSSQWPALWFFSSLLLRMSAILTGFYFIGREHWERWLLLFLGFLLARLVAQQFALSSGGDDTCPVQKASYAP